MCCFSGRVEQVEGTKILGRMIGWNRQLLVYEMQLAAESEVAMILPIPVPPRSDEEAVRFRSLKHYPDLFEDLDALYQPTRSLGPDRGKAFATARSQPLLAVHSVGAFEASFVPSLADFARISPRFRLPPGTIDLVPDYADWGFAVFQLAPAKEPALVHPMAFEFPTRDPSRLFFPTLHIHDGELHEEAEFSHHLYAQGVEERGEWRSSDHDLRHLPGKRHEEDLFDLGAPMLRREMFGKLPNRDTWVTLHGASGPTLAGSRNREGESPGVSGRRTPAG